MFLLLAIKTQFGKENDLLQKRAHGTCGTQQRPKAHLIRCSDPCHISHDFGKGHRQRRCLESDSNGKLGTSIGAFVLLQKYFLFSLLKMRCL